MAKRDQQRRRRRDGRARDGARKRPEARRAPAEVETPELSPRSAKSRLPLVKLVAFYGVTVALGFGLLELVLALAGIRPGIVEEDPYVGFASQIQLYQPTASGSQLRTARNKLGFFNDQTFPKAKARGAFRVFTVGGSTTYGRPFDDATSFSGWLRTYLGAAAPAVDWQVINAGGISYASYRVATLMEELVKYQPDLFVIYTGHNEFLEKRTYSRLIAEPEVLTRTKLLLLRSRLWTVGRRIADRQQRQRQERYELTGEVQEVLDSSAGLDYYFRDEPFQRQVIDHYRFNLQRMIQLAQTAGAEVILVTVPANEKDFSPFKSQHREGLGEAERARHESLLVGAAAALAEGDGARGRPLAEEAVEIDPQHAKGHYQLGRALLAVGQADLAGAAFRRAIAEDVCPLRALPEIEEIITETAARNGVAVVDYQALLRERMRERAGHEILGEEMFLDHVHPTVEANGVLARALVDRMVEMGWVKAAADWHDAVGDRVRTAVLGRIDAEAQARAYKNLSKVLIWAGKKREAERYVQLAGETLGDDWEVHYSAGTVHLNAQRYHEAIESFEQATTLQTTSAPAHDLLGVAYAAAGRLDEAIAAGRKAVELDPRQAVAWNNLATHHSAGGDPASALETVREALRLDGDFAEAHNTLGKIHFDAGELAAAIESYGRAIELRPNYLDAAINRGLVLGEQMRFDEAHKAFEAVLALNPRLPMAHLGKGKALFGLGQPAAAVAALETALEIDPNQLEAYELLAVSLAGSGRPERAWEVLKQGLRLNPDAARLHHLHGRFLAQEGTYEAAASAFETAIGLDAGLTAARVDLGNLRMAQGRHELAITAFRETLARHPNDDRLHHILGTALLIAGNLDEGRQHLERALAINPENAAAAADLEQVRARFGGAR